MPRVLRDAYWVVTFCGIAAAVVLGLMNTPADPALGTAQRLLYLHLPFALNAYLACLIVFGASAAYLATRSPRWDSVAVDAARVAVVACTVVLTTGVLLSRTAWGEWWVWSPKLTFSLVLWALFVVYVVVRPLIGPRQRRALISAVYAVIAFLDAPLVYLSVRLLPDVHPTSMALDPASRWTLLVACAAGTLLCLGMMFVPLQAPGRLEASKKPRALPSQTPRVAGL